MRLYQMVINQDCQISTGLFSFLIYLFISNLIYMEHEFKVGDGVIVNGRKAVIVVIAHDYIIVEFKDKKYGLGWGKERSNALKSYTPEYTGRFWYCNETELTLDIKSELYK